MFPAPTVECLFIRMLYLLFISFHLIPLEVHAMFEHRKQPLLTPREFLIRQLIYLCVAFLIIAVSLFLGMLGYHLWR
jgi:hypothetical protein